MASFYILFSELLNKYYVGITMEDPLVRLKKHNENHYGTHFTSSVNDWTIKLIIPCESFSIARKMELYVKKMKSSKFTKRLLLIKKNNRS